MTSEQQTVTDSIEEQKSRERIHAMADAWFIANQKDLGHYDPISEALDDFKFHDGSRILEIGCANGWRLKKLKDKHPKLEVCGLDPSQMAIDNGKKFGFDLKKGTADYLPWSNDAFDIVIYGFCMYMTYPSYWFSIVAESARVLRNGGYIMIHDYANPELPYVYVERVGIENPHWAFHADYNRLWLAHPFFQKVEHYIFMTHTTLPQSVTIIQKNAKILLTRQELPLGKPET